MTDKDGRPFVIRRLDREDRPALDAMYDDFTPKRIAQGLPPDRRDARTQWLRRVLARGDHLVVEVDGRLVGHGMIIPFDDDTVELANFMHQSVRSRGIGTDLNRALLDVARERGHRRVWLSVEPSNRAAIKSYARVGFLRLPGSLSSPELEMQVLLDEQAGNGVG